MSPKRIAILGSTGSIGRQTLEVCAAHPERLRVVALAAGTNAALLAEQALAFSAKVAVIAETDHEPALRRALSASGIEAQSGCAALDGIGARDDVDIVVAGLAGMAGLAPVLAAVRAGKRVAIANKEPLVAAGELITREAVRSGAQLVPVDSEHSALFQVLEGRDRATVKRLLLTASGGPFRDLTDEELWQVTAEQALAHPTWVMGRKITVDSATLMNKGLEVIEARWLFGLPVSQIEVVIHPQSIVHSAVEFVDGSMLAQMGRPDMRLPIQYALSYPDRWEADWGRLDLTAVGRLDFRPLDRERFPCVRLAYEAAAIGGTMPAVLNAADEVAVARFLSGGIKLPEIARLVEQAMSRHSPIAHPDLDDIERVDAGTRRQLSAEAVAH